MPQAGLCSSAISSLSDCVFGSDILLDTSALARSLCRRYLDILSLSLAPVAKCFPQTQNEISRAAPPGCHLQQHEFERPCRAVLPPGWRCNECPFHKEDPD